MIILVALALLPAVVLCMYVYKRDSVEKEPLGLLMKLFFLGALCCFPAAYIEEYALEFIKNFFPVKAVAVMEMGAIKSYTFGSYLYLFAKSFIGIAFVEEGVKFFVLTRVTSDNKNFNCLFDGLIYSVFVSLGFAALENVLYVVNLGFTVGVARALMSVPGHMFFAVLMGCYYSSWHVTYRAELTEKYMKKKGLIERIRRPFDSENIGLKGLLVATAAHGFYDFCCMSGTKWGMYLLYAFVLFMYHHCFKKIADMSWDDRYEDEYIEEEIEEKYPEFFDKF